MSTADEELVRELMQIESELDKALEQENFERMNLLLEQREILLKSFSNIPAELAESIVQADKVRLDKMNALLENLKNQALQARTSQQALKSYSAQQQKTNFDERK